jgi:hypothetical protein
MRRTIVLTAAVAALSVFGITGLRAPADAALAPVAVAAKTQAATCALTNYSLVGSFNRIGGTASFNLYASGSCVGAPGVNVSLSFTSVGPWSCDGGVATGSGTFQPTNDVPQLVGASLVNAGGEYVVEMHSLVSAAAGQITTLPVACDLGETQANVGGTGDLTFAT